MCKLRLAVVALLAVGLIACRPAARPEGEGPQRDEPTIALEDHRTGKTENMPLEEYLQGVVAGEIPNHWPVEALGAQAIVARTFTLKKLDEGLKPSTDEKKFQAYNADNINDNIRQAVKNTRGQVITHEGKLVNAFFHSCSGGKTATPREGLGFTQEPTPYLQVVNDPEPCDDPAKESWQAAFSRSEIVAAAAEQDTQLQPDFASVAIKEYGPSGRALTIAFGDQKVHAVPLRLALGPTRMRSTLLTDLRLEGDQVVMAGRGFGHGVGLPQFSALQMARAGQSPTEIIERFYQNVEITAWYR